MFNISMFPSKEITWRIFSFFTNFINDKPEKAICIIMIFILRSTFYPNLKQIGWKITELLNGCHFEGGAAGMGAAPPRTALQRYGDIA